MPTTATIAAARRRPKGGRAHGIRTYQSSGYDPSYGEMAGETSYQGGGMPAPGPGEVPMTDYAGQAPPRRTYDDMPEQPVEIRASGRRLAM